MRLMSIENYQELRADAYRLLALCYYEPVEETRDIVAKLKEVLVYLYPETVSLLEEMEGALQQRQEEILLDYARLFIGPFDVLAAPYGSIYLENGRQLMGDSTLAACRLYNRAGLVISDKLKDAPDHIAVELEFMYYLIFQGLFSNEEKYAIYQQEFLKEHLGAWIDDFTNVVQTHASTIFYKNLALITKLTVGGDKAVGLAS